MAAEPRDLAEWIGGPLPEPSDEPPDSLTAADLWNPRPDDPEYRARRRATLADIARRAAAAEPPELDGPTHPEPLDAVATRALLGTVTAERIPELLPLDVPGAVVTRLSEVEPECVEWLWPGRIPYGKLTIIEGDPGIGKSTITLDLAARVSRGELMPDGSGGGAPAAVVLVSAEDGLADTIAPRLEAARADRARVYALAIVDGDGERSAAIPDDVARLEETVRQAGARLVIVDPLMAHLPGSVNSYRDQDVRRALAPLAAMAERTGAAVVVVRHLTKAAGGNPLYRGGGSIGITAAARAVLLVAPDPDDETGERRILAAAKMNLAPLPPSLAYRVVDATVPAADGPIGAARIAWEGATAHTAAALLAVPAGAEERGALAEAGEWLRDALADGPLPARDVQQQARAAGIADHTLRRARERLVHVAKVGRPGERGHWQWELRPEDVHPPAEDVQDAHIPGDGHLRESWTPSGRFAIDRPSESTAAEPWGEEL